MPDGRATPIRVLLVQEKCGQDLVEYALCFALVALVLIAGIHSLSSQIQSEFTHINQTLIVENPSPHPGKPRPLKNQGDITYDPPGTMTLGESVTVDAVVRRLASAKAPPIDGKSALNYGLSPNRPLVTQALPVADEMVVTLRSMEAGAFDIDPKETDVTRASRGLSVGGHAEWHWVVTPKVAGEQHLVLHAIFIDHHGLADDQGSWEASITVRVLPWYVRAGDAVLEALAKHWTGIIAWLASASGLLGTIIAVKKLRNKQAPRGAEDDEPGEEGEAESDGEEAAGDEVGCPAGEQDTPAPEDETRV